MRYSTIDCMMGGGQGLAQHLSTKDLCATYVAAFSSKNIVLDAFEFQKIDEIFKNRMHVPCHRQRLCRYR